MPIFEYHCNSCGIEFETIVNSTTIPGKCPQCDSSDTKKLVSSFSFKTSDRGSRQNSSSGGCGGCTSKNCSTCS